MNNRAQGSVVLIATIIVAMVLMLIPLPDFLRFFRPEWVVLTLLYWALALPERVGVGISWAVGLLMDVMMGGALGVLAFSYALVTYLVVHSHLQLRQYPLWQQSLIVMILVLVVQLIKVTFSPLPVGWYVVTPALVSILSWPIVYMTLRKVRRVFGVK